MRVFTEPEIAQILRRAAERQASTPAASSAQGLTLVEIEALAAESGLDVAHVRAAAAEMAPASPAVRSRSASHVFVDRTLALPFSEDGWGEVVAELQNRFGASGMAAFSPGTLPSGALQTYGRNREWSHTDGLGVETRVLVTDRGDTTRLRLSQRVGLMSEMGDSLILAFAAAILPALGLLSSLTPTGLAAVAAALVAVALFVGIYFWDKAWRVKKQDGLVDLSTDLVERLAAYAPASAEQAVPATATPALSLDALGEAPESDSPRASARTATGR